MKKFNRAIVAAFLMVFSISCSTMKDSKAAEPTVEKFHQQFNAMEFKAIYDQSGSQMKEVTTEKELTDILEAVHRQLGEYKSSTPAGGHVDAGPETNMVTLAYLTEFSEGARIEQFIVSVSGNTAKLEGYHINDLITK